MISCFDVMRSIQSSALPCQHLFAANIASWCSLSADCYIAETIRRVIWILASDTVFANSTNISTNIETAMLFTASWCSLSPDCYCRNSCQPITALPDFVFVTTNIMICLCVTLDLGKYLHIPAAIFSE